MSETTITIPIDLDTATRYSTASEQERRKIQILLRLLLRNSTASTTSSLQHIMDAMSDEAQANGLTLEILDEILRDDS